MNDVCILVVESDILIRGPLAAFLRECGYRVIEAASGDEAQQFFASDNCIDVVLVDADAADELGGFVLAKWVRTHHPGVEVTLAGTLSKSVEAARDLCKDGPALNKPYDHHAIHDHIKQLLAARARNKQ